MNIGIDIDNVISNFNEALKEEFLKHDKELRNTGIVNPNLYMTKGMFDWSEDEIWGFYLENIERIVKSLEVKPGAKEYIDKLKRRWTHDYNYYRKGQWRLYRSMEYNRKLVKTKRDKI